MRFALAFLLVSTSVFAQTAGNYVLRANARVPDTIAVPYTLIDIGSPFTSNGVISTVVVRSRLAPCDDAFKVKFFRPGGSGLLVPYAERGPFDITGALTTVTFTPAVAVQQGDLLGITALSNCAGLIGQAPIRDADTLVYNGDVVTGVSSSAPSSELDHFALAAFAAPNTNTEVRTTILVASGSLQGAFGATFRTDVFLVNARPWPSAGRLVYHPEATSGTPADPSLAFELDFAESLTLPDFVGQSLHLSGKGSIDVYTRIGFEPPVVSARVYETSTTGTKGFTMDALPEHEALDAELAEVAVLVTPSNPSAFRMNMGYRTLDTAAVIVFQLVNSNGLLSAARNLSVAPNRYEQVDVAQFFNRTLQAGDTIFVYTEAGSAFVYGSIIDNLSNDPSIQIAKPLE